MAEGPKIVGDLQAAGFHSRMIIEGDDVEKVSFLQHPQGVLGVFEMPEQYDEPLKDGELCLALDGVQDPGNVGTIIRLADWFGIRHVFCSLDCADIFNPKATQATMGALARVEVHYIDLASELSKASAPVYGTFLDGENIYQQTLSPHGIIVMGNEGKGISHEIERLVTHKLYIPPYPAESQTVESLNVAIATAITCAEFRRRTALSSES